MEAAPPPALPAELVEEILLRLPPDEPACILRASLVCKAWGSAVSHRSFRRRLHELYPAPPVLGFFYHWSDSYRSWRILDFRHGRALLFSYSPRPELLVWEPFTGDERRVPSPPVFGGRHTSVDRGYPGMAVVCAADGCDHRDCHGGPFQLVFVFNLSVGYDDYDTLACVYSSETGTWGEPSSVHGTYDMDFTNISSVLAGRTLLYLMSDNGFIVECDLERHGLAMFDALEIEPGLDSWRLNLVLAEDGGMRVSQELATLLKFWKREANDSPDTQWVLSRIIDLGSLPQIGLVLMHNAPREANDSPDAQCADKGTRVHVVGFAERANLICVDTVGGIFTIELQSEKVRKVCHEDHWTDEDCISSLIPVVGFYKPGFLGEHRDLLSSGPSEEAGGEERRKDEKGSNAIEERDFDNIRFSHVLNTRVPSYKEVALQKAQEVDDPLDDFPKSAPNEESVTCAANKDDAGNSKTFHSDVEDAAAPSRKGDSEEGCPEET